MSLPKYNDRFHVFGGNIMKEKYTDHTISLVVHNKSGVMSRVSGLITRRGFNIESITVGKTKEKDLTRMTIVVKGDDRSIEQIQKQLAKLVDTVKVSPISPENLVAREIGLINIRLEEGDKAERIGLFQLIALNQAQIVDTSHGGIIVEITGPSEKIDGFIDLLPPSLIVGIARTGIVAMQKLSSVPRA
jgi:acetolactate synthase I/III small subunit